MVSDNAPKVKIGDRFQQEKKYNRNKFGDGSNWSLKPGRYKYYPKNPKIELPKPKSIKTESLNDAIQNRRSIRDFSKKQ